jgi:hypothetical protein
VPRGHPAKPGHPISTGGSGVSIVRIGLAETKNFSEGYDSIFGKKKGAKAKKSEPKASAAKKSKKRKKK